MEKKPSLGKDSSFLLKKGSLALVLRAGGMITQYLFVLVVARMLGAKALGTFTLSYTIVQLVAIISLMGLDNLLVRVIAVKKAEGDFSSVKTAYKQFLRLTAISSLIWTFFLLVFSNWIATSIFRKPALATSIQVIGFSLPPFVLMLIDSAAFRGYKNMTGFTIFRALIPLIGAGLVLISVYANLELNPISCFTISTFIVSGISYFAWHRFSKLQDIAYAPNLHWKEVLSTSYPMMLTGSIFFILGWTDNLILGIFRTEEIVGIYDTAFKIATASAIALIAVNSIQAPTFAELFGKGEFTRLKNYVFNSTRITFYITLPITVAILLFPSQILSIFGPEFRTASFALCIMAIGNFVNSITGSVGILLQMTGHQNYYNKIVTSTAIGSIILNFILIPRYGITGAAIASAIAKIFQNTLSVIYTYKKLNIVSIYLPGIKYIIKPKEEVKL